jgi:hypothetical protein
MNKTKFDGDIDRAAENLKRLNGEKLPVRIFGILDHVSKSGMMRKISLFYVKENEPICICREVKVSGAGMDMGFHLAYNVYMAAYGDAGHAYQENFQFHWI